MGIPVIKPGEPLSVYEDGVEVARVRLRYSDLGVVLECQQRALGLTGLMFTPWKDMAHITSVNGRLAYAVFGKRGEETERTT